MECLSSRHAKMVNYILDLKRKNWSSLASTNFFHFIFFVV